MSVLSGESEVLRGEDGTQVLPPPGISGTVLVAVPVRVVGTDENGASFVEESVTVSISRQGARISLTHSLLPDDVVIVRNLENGKEEEFRVVGACQQVFGARREWGLAPAEEGSAIWGLRAPRSREDTEFLIDMQCAACGLAAKTAVSSIEYQVLLAVGLISRHCRRCVETTRWQPVAEKEAEAAGARRDAPDGVEQRQAMRLHLNLGVRVRRAEGEREVVRTRDVSKSGICFVSAMAFEVGEEVYITRPFADREVPSETKGRIVWVSEDPEGHCYGVQYTR